MPPSFPGIPSAGVPSVAVSSPRGRGLLLATACGLALCGAPSAHAQIIQQYLPDISQPVIGQAGAALAPDVTATPRGPLETQPGTTVETRPHPEFQTQGIHVGSFYIQPQVTESVGYNSNLFADRSGRGAFLVNTVGGVQVRSDVANKSLSGGVLFDNSVFPQYSSQGFTNFTANLEGTYDIGRDRLTVRYRHADLHIARGSVDSGNFDNPIPFHIDTLYASYLIPFSRLSFEPAIEVSNQRFSNGTFQGVPLIETINTHNAGDVRLTTRYALAPQRDVVVVARGITQNYYENQAGQAARNSKTVEVLTGLDFSLNAVIRFRALVGYEQRTFTSSVYSTRSAPVINADVIWTPSQLTTVSAGLNRSIEDGLSTNATGFTYTTLQAKVDHELRRNVILSGHVQAQLADYTGNQGSQEIYNAGAQVDWRLNRNVTLGARYDYTYRESSPALGQTFSQSLALISLGLKL